MRKNKTLIFFILLISTAVMLYLSLGRIAIYVFAKTHDLDISCKKCGAPLAYSGLNVVDRKTGVGFFANTAFFKPGWDKGLTVGFYLKAVHFIRKNAKKPADASDTLMELVAVPFDSRWIYKEISGEIALFNGGVKIKNLAAVSNEIKLSITGDVYNNNTAKSDITIYFADSLVDKIPGELSKVLLTEEKGGWKSLSVRLEGNYKEPSIQVSSKRFRLNIKTLADPKS